MMAQPVEDMSRLGSNHLRGFTKNSQKVGDTYSAIDFLNEYLIRNPENIKYSYKLAELYRETRDYTNAALWYKKVVDADEVNYPLARFYLAKMLKMEGVYDEAMINFSDFKKTVKQLSDEALFKKILKNEIDGIDYARKVQEPTKRIQIYHLDRTVNNNHVDLSPLALDNNTLIYASLNLDTLKYFNQKDSSQKVPVRQFYYAKRSGDTWKGNGLAEDAFNEAGINTGNGTISTDGMRFYFTRCEKNWKNENICKIYVSRKEGSQWTAPEEVTELNHPQYTTTQPAIGTDSRSGGEVIYFSSNRPGGKGGFDLWYALLNKKTGTFKDPKNMGSVINTISDEITPWYDTQTRNLFFSSDGHPSMGGLDIFKAAGEMRTWEEPENMGIPVNSCADELYYSYTPNHEDGFFVSNRRGGFSHRSPTCCDDIYYFRLLDYIKIGVTGKVLAIQDSSIYKILEQNLNKDQTVGEYDDAEEQIEPAKGAVINLFWVNEKSKADMFIARDTIKSDGSYYFRLEPEMKYKLVVENFGFFNKTLTTTTVGVVKSDTIHLDAIYINKIPLEPLTIKNIYYEFAKHELTDNSKLVIDSTIFRIMTENPTIVVELRSHTDSVSTAGYNLKLSQRRAESVVNYLISKGISQERLIAKGFGKNMPIAPNTNPDGSDNPEGRQKNRRTEFRIVGSLEQYSDIKYEE